MEHATKSAIIARKKVGEDEYHCIINLFDVNDAHTTIEVPKQCLEFPCSRIVIKGLTINFLTLGNDIVINDLDNIVIDEDGDNLTITGVQN